MIHYFFVFYKLVKFMKLVLQFLSFDILRVQSKLIYLQTCKNDQLLYPKSR